QRGGSPEPDDRRRHRADRGCRPHSPIGRGQARAVARLDGSARRTSRRLQRRTWAMAGPTQDGRSSRTHRPVDLRVWSAVFGGCEMRPVWEARALPPGCALPPAAPARSAVCYPTATPLCRLLNVSKSDPATPAVAATSALVVSNRPAAREKFTACLPATPSATSTTEVAP